MRVKKKLLFKIILIFFTASVIYAISLDNIYSATVTMLPQSNDINSTKFSGLAALAGVNLNSNSMTNESFYGDFLRSNHILDKLISRKWKTASDSVLLPDFLEIDYDNNHFSPEDLRNYETKKYLKKKVIHFSISSENGLMQLIVSMPLEPLLSCSIANWLANELHKFNEAYRKEKQSEEIESITNQINNAQAELIKAENILSVFLKRNKNYLQSIELKLEFERLQREVSTESSVYSELRKQYEIAKIDFAKKKHTINILDYASIPVQKSSPRRLILVLLITTCGSFLLIVILILRLTVQHNILSNNNPMEI